MSKFITIGMGIVGGLFLLSGVSDYLASKYITHQMIALMQILIGCVIVIGALILDRMPVTSSIFQNKINFPENTEENPSWINEARKYSGNTPKKGI